MTTEIGKHVASLNLFMESDGSFHITVSGGNLTPYVPAYGDNPMQALATMIEEAGPRFVENWKDWRRDDS